MPRSRSSAGLQKLLSSCGQPVYAVDDQRVIVAANAACLAWLGVAEDDLCGLTCDYHSQAGSTSERVEGTASHLHPTHPLTIARALCPPPRALAGVDCSGMLEVPLARAGETGLIVERRRADYHPLLGAHGHRGGVVVIVSPREVKDALSDDKTLTADELHLQLAAQRRQWHGRYAWERLVGTSPAMRRARELAKIATDSRAPTVVCGPSGSGREHFARCLHHARYEHEDRPLIPIHGTACDALDLESLLARLVQQAPATGHTLLLTQADEFPSDAQLVLLRWLQTHQQLKTICTASQSLQRLAAAGRYRAELASLLEVLSIDLPPLAERLQDLPLLVQMLVERRNALGKQLCEGFTPDALDDLAGYGWPGNLSELTDVVDQACDNAEGPLVTRADLPVIVRQALDARQHPRREFVPIDLDNLLHELEAEVLRRALQAARGNKAQAARLLGISRARIIRRLDELNITIGGMKLEGDAEPPSEEIFFE